MSKSKGNGIDPLDAIGEVGADAVRLSLVIGSTPGNPIPIGENKIKGYRNFVNKLWNAGRFVQFQCGEEKLTVKEIPKPKNLTESWILSRLSTVACEVSEALEKYEISIAGDLIYHFIWDEFCDWFIEATKVEPHPEFLAAVFGEILKLAHPLCPFVTESIRNELFEAQSLIHEDFPELKEENLETIKQFSTVQNIIRAIRKVRTEKNLTPREKINISISAEKETNWLQKEAKLLTQLAALGELKIEETAPKPEQAVVLLINELEIFVEVPFDAETEKTRLAKEIATLEKSIAGLEGRLANKSYTEKAPVHLVAETQKELERAQEEKVKLSTELEKL
jgi:valyl-tRNA synthetase